MQRLHLTNHSPLSLVYYRIPSNVNAACALSSARRMRTRKARAIIILHHYRLRFSRGISQHLFFLWPSLFFRIYKHTFVSRTRCDHDEFCSKDKIFVDFTPYNERKKSGTTLWKLELNMIRLFKQLD